MRTYEECGFKKHKVAIAIYLKYLSCSGVLRSNALMVTRRLSKLLLMTKVTVDLVVTIVNLAADRAEGKTS